MIITKMALPRRTFLRGLGASLALPLLDAMVPALTAARNAPVSTARAVNRVGFVYIPNGVSMNAVGNAWKPVGEGRNFEWSPILTPLAPYREHTLIVSGLAHAQAESMGDGQGDHSACQRRLAERRPREADRRRRRAGGDDDRSAGRQRDRPRQSARFPRARGRSELPRRQLREWLQLRLHQHACRGARPQRRFRPRTIRAWCSSGSLATAGRADQRSKQARRARSILDSVTDDLARLQGSVGPADRARMDEYVESVREVERRIQKAESTARDSAIPSLDRPVGIPDSFGDHLKLMYDLQWLAFQADLTRVFTMMLGRELVGRAYPELGVPESHHGLSHHRDDPVNLSKLTKINTYHVELLTHFLEKLKATPDGDGTLLDHVLLLYGGGLSNPNEHAHTDLPLVVLGGAGGLKGGRHLQFPKGTPMMNLLLAMMDRVGVRVENYGDSSGHLELEPSGAASESHGVLHCRGGRVAPTESARTANGCDIRKCSDGHDSASLRDRQAWDSGRRDEGIGIGSHGRSGAECRDGASHPRGRGVDAARCRQTRRRCGRANVAVRSVPGQRRRS